MLLGCGCFWSKQYHLSRLPGVITTHVGFAGGTLPHPTYAQVCGKQTGHAEVTRVTFDTRRLAVRDLLRFFFRLHDPTIDRRGRGGQYRSFIGLEKETAKNATLVDQIKTLLQDLKAASVALKTEFSYPSIFYSAAGRHQQYCDVRGIEPRPIRRLSGPEMAVLGSP